MTRSGRFGQGFESPCRRGAGPAVLDPDVIDAITRTTGGCCRCPSGCGIPGLCDRTSGAFPDWSSSRSATGAEV